MEARGKVGPYQKRLESLWDLLQIGVGYWGETSADLGMVIRAIAESRVLFRSRENGRPFTES